MADSFNMIVATGSYQFRINHSATKDTAVGKSITSPNFRVGEHDWAILYFPRGNKKENCGKFMSVFLELRREAAADVRADLEFSLLGKDGNVASTTRCTSSHTFTSDESDWGFSSFLRRENLEETFVEEGHFTLRVSVTLRERFCTGALPAHRRPSGIPCGIIQKFREESACTDVTFNVDGNRFVVHRLILAAHSPVFRAELFGPMAESNLDEITVNEMTPSAFKAMLDFMYDGSLTVDKELADGEEVMMFLQNLLVTADRYAVEELKSLCVNKLVDSISLNNVLALLELAEKHSCGYLKTKCLKFVVEKDNPVSLMVREEYVKLVQRYPNLLVELKEMATSK